MPAKEYYSEQIEKEFSAARQALSVGNDGKARVCARRAAGLAIAWFLSAHPKPAWGQDAMHQLLQLKDDLEFPGEIRDAAVRLTTRISEQFTYPFSTDPIADSRLIVGYFRKRMESNAS